MALTTSGSAKDAATEFFTTAARNIHTYGHRENTARGPTALVAAAMIRRDWYVATSGSDLGARPCRSEVMCMLTVESSVYVDGITGSEITEFLLSPTDERYRAWWPGTHLQLHVVSGARGHVGDVVWMDEYVGSRRLRMSAVVVAAEPGRRIVWRFTRWVRLPGWLRLELVDSADGCLVRHTVEVGYRGVGRVLDPILRLYLSSRFAAALDEHVRAEFPRLRDYLHGATAA